MGNLKQIVYLSQSDYDSLINDTHTPKQYTKNGKTIYLDENILYITNTGIAATDLTGVLPVSKGGTGNSSFLNNQLLVGNGTNAIATKVIATSISSDDSTIPNTKAVFDYAVQKVSSTDNAIARFDGTGGKIQNSGVIIDDSNNVSTDGTVYIKQKAQDISEAVKTFSVAGQTVTYTTLWGDTGTFTTQDTKNTAGSTDSNSKLYLIGATTQAANPTTNSYQYTYVTEGLLSSTKIGVNATGVEKVHLEWNATDSSLDFIFDNEDV